MLKRVRYILFPLSIGYGFIIWFRNKLFDKNILRSASFNLPIICVGNLALGGTGKTPMTEYLVRLLEGKYSIATLSRGYKRKTKGFAIADETTSAIDIGDEPMQLHKKFPGITVAVAEERVVGIPQLLHEKPGTEVIILDDAFQHREIRAGLNIMLTGYKNLYTDDLMLPAGNLRDIKSSSKRADIIIVTKTDSNLTREEKESIITNMKLLSNQKIYFTTIDYDSPYHLFSNAKRFLEKDDTVLLVCGIANSKPLENSLNNYGSKYEMLAYKDHHIFTINDLKQIKDQFSKIESHNKIILTTEKDATRLSSFKNDLKDLPVFVLPMAHQFLFDEEISFQDEILKYVQGVKKAN